ncbi:MAG: sugar phosphate nucleotidyltransferase [Candidatus Dependentiae bacterium]
MVFHGKKLFACLLVACSAFTAHGTNMNKKNLYCVILAGGDGSRLWPLSRQCKPKQLLTLGSDVTLLEQAIDRIAPMTTKDHIWISTTAKHEENIRLSVEHRVGRILVEPGSRNTGPAILLCCMEIHAIDPNAVIVFLPADPFIPKRDWEKCRDFLDHAVDHATKHDDIVLLGVEPTYPATGYGYIEFDPQDALEQQAPYKVSRFREKPSFEVAQQYIEQGNKLWNISIFCAQASTFMREFQQEASEMFAGVKNYLDNVGSYEKVVADSIDYAVMERSKHVSVMPVDFSWCDVGNIEVFLSLKQQYNTLDANFIGVDARNNLVDVPGKLVALVGVDDLCVVEVDDALLITKRDAAENVRGIVKLLKQGSYKKHL